MDRLQIAVGAAFFAIVILIVLFAKVNDERKRRKLKLARTHLNELYLNLKLLEIEVSSGHCQGAQVREDDKIEEERRLFYVALPRCEKEFYMFTSKKMRSRFVKEMEPFITSYHTFTTSFTEPEPLSR